MNIFLFIWRSITKSKHYWMRLSKMQDEKHENRSNSNTGDGTTPNDNEIRIVIRDGIGLFASGIFAGIFFASDHFIFGLWFSYIGLIAAFDIPFNHWSINNPAKYYPARICQFVLMAAIAIWFFCWTSYMLHPQKITPPISSQSSEIVIPEWQPPELPLGSSNVSIFTGGLRRNFSIPEAEISGGKYGTKFTLKDAPEPFKENANNLPGFSPRDRYVWVRKYMPYPVGDKVIDFPILPLVVSNRFYVQVDIPFKNEKQTLLFNDDFRYQLTNLPQPWDVNFNSTQFEIVNELTNPVLQVTYKSAHEIQVEGIFIVGGNNIYAAFNGKPIFISAQNPNAVFPTNAAYDILFPGQKAIFQYPYNDFPNKLAVEPTRQIAVQQPDYIEGTQFTQKRLSEIFPFGYAVFFFGQNRILRNEIFKNGMMDWKLDVEVVTIEPDFYTGQVTWKIPIVNTTPYSPGAQVTMIGGSISVTAPLKEGCIRRGGMLLGNKPVIHVMTLGDNQRTPVFAIGFRIPSEGEGRPPNPPYFFIQP